MRRARRSSAEYGGRVFACKLKPDSSATMAQVSVAGIDPGGCGLANRKAALQRANVSSRRAKGSGLQSEPSRLSAGLPEHVGQRWRACAGRCLGT